MVSWKFLDSAAGRDVLTSAPSPHAGPSFCDCLVEEEAGNFELRMPARLTVSPTASLGSTQSPLRLAPQEVTAKTKRWPFPVGMLSNFQVICNPVIFLSCPNGILTAPAPSWCRFVSLSTRLKARNCLCNDLAIGAAFACMVCALGVSGRVFVRLPVFVVSQLCLLLSLLSLCYHCFCLLLLPFLLFLPDLVPPLPFRWYRARKSVLPCPENSWTCFVQNFASSRTWQFRERLYLIFRHHHRDPAPDFPFPFCGHHDLHAWSQVSVRDLLPAEVRANNRSLFFGFSCLDGSRRDGMSSRFP